MKFKILGITILKNYIANKSQSKTIFSWIPDFSGMTKKSVIPENSKNLSGIYNILKRKFLSKIQSRFLLSQEGQKPVISNGMKQSVTQGNEMRNLFKLISSLFSKGIFSVNRFLVKTRNDNNSSIFSWIPDFTPRVLPTRRAGMINSLPKTKNYKQKTNTSNNLSTKYYTLSPIKTKSFSSSSSDFFFRPYIGFTLVELIVVITILAILGTIAFVSFKNYSSQARDSVRLTDISTLYKALILSKERTGEYPLPSDSKDITYSGGIVWHQGTIGDNVIRYLGNMSNKPIDPKFNIDYTYSVTSNNQEFQIAGITEEKNDISLNPIISDVYATEKNFSKYTAYVKGDFDGLFVVSKTGSSNQTCSSIAIPSIILANLTNTELKNAGSGTLVYKGKSNIPYSYFGALGDNIVYTGAFLYKDFNDPSLVIYTGCILPNTLTGAITIAQNLKKSYENTEIQKEGGFDTIVNTIDSKTLTDIGVGIVNNYFTLKGITGKKISSNYTLAEIPSFMCTSQPVIPHSTDYNQDNPAEFNQDWVYSDTSGNCTFACESGYARDNNTKSCIQDLCQGNLADLNGIVKLGSTQSVSQTWTYDTEDNDSVCRYICADGHTYNSSSKKCEPNNCEAKDILIGDHDYSIPSMNHGENLSKTSNPITISGGTLLFDANFGCNLGDVSYIVGTEVYKSTTCDSNYTVEGETCKADTKTVACSGNPSNSSWNTVSSILQTWDGTTWLPTNEIAYSTDPSTTECRYQCNTNFHTENGGTSCISNTKSCTVANGIGQQSWNIGTNNWGTCTVVSCNTDFVESSNTCIADVCGGTVPTNGVSNATSQTVSKSWSYNTTPGQCTFKCDTNYTWNGSSCVANTQTYTCPATKPANSIVNTVSSYIQTWNGTAWNPIGSTTVYNTIASTTSCRYICSVNYHTEDNGDSCISNTASCSITNGTGQQTWNGTSRGTCSVVSCNSGYSVSGNSCVPNNCLSSTQTVNGRSYSVPAFNHGTTTIQSTTVSISNGSITYSQTFACNLGSVSTSGGETGSPTCNINYIRNGSSCVAIINGTCGATVGTCITGTVSGDNGLTACGTTRTWSCLGVNGGTTISCSIVNAACVTYKWQNVGIACGSIPSGVGVCNPNSISILNTSCTTYGTKCVVYLGPYPPCSPDGFTQIPGFGIAQCK